MQSTTSSIESAYLAGIDALSPAERVARSAAMFQWTRDQLGRRISCELGETNETLLKWHVALRLYGNEPAIRKMIEQKLADVSS